LGRQLLLAALTDCEKLPDNSPIACPSLAAKSECCTAGSLHQLKFPIHRYIGLAIPATSANAVSHPLALSPEGRNR
jgi:hypothetical protein